MGRSRSRDKRNKDSKQGIDSDPDYVPPSGSETSQSGTFVAATAIMAHEAASSANAMSSSTSTSEAGPRTSSSSSSGANTSGRPMLTRTKTMDYFPTVGPEIPEEKRSVGSYLAADLPDHADTQVAMRYFSEHSADVSGPTLELLSALMNTNGEDAYSAVSVAVGKLPLAEVMKIPNDIKPPVVADCDVGSERAAANMKVTYLSQVFALNFLAAPEGDDSAKFALLRMELVRAGWLETDIAYEVHLVNPVTLTPANFYEPLASVIAKQREYRTAAYLLPFAAEIVFRTTGHHFLTGEGEPYVEKYRRIFKACLVPGITELMKPPTMFHKVAHWVTPKKVWRVLEAQVARSHLPDAIRIRRTAAPAGCALVTTTSAVLKAMMSGGLYDKIRNHAPVDLGFILEVAEAIRFNPPQYHQTYWAYGLANMTAEEVRKIEKAKESAIIFAPYSQAYINAMFEGVDLGKAKTLQKHAISSPMILKRAEKFFKKVAKAVPQSPAELFSNQLTFEDEA